MLQRRPRRASRWLLLLLGAPWLSAVSDGCGGDAANTSAGGAAAAGGSGGGGGAATTTTSPSRTDEGTACADAIALQASDTYFGAWESGRIAYPGDRDFFRFEATEGQWLALVTVANSDQNPKLVDPVLTLWDERGDEQLAENDDAIGYVPKTADPEIIYRIPRTGSYCLQVWEASDWASADPVGEPSFTYDVGVVPLDDEHLPGLTFDSDPSPSNDSADTAQSPAAANASMMLLAGMLDPVADEDFFEVRFIEGDANLVVWLPSGGATGNGATLTPGAVSVIDRDGHTVIARIAGHDYERRLLNFPLPPDSARLYFQVTRPAGELGTNDFYLLKYYASGEFGYVPEEDEVGNDDPEGAEWAEPEEDSADNPELSAAWIMGQLTPGDADYWAYDAIAGELLNLRCFAQRHGSGLRGMHVALSTEAEPAVPIAQDTETDLEDLYWSSSFPSSGSGAAIPIAETGTYLLLVDLVTGSQDPEVTSNFYQCRLFVTRPGPPAVLPLSPGGHAIPVGG